MIRDSFIEVQFCVLNEILTVIKYNKKMQKIALNIISSDDKCYLKEIIFTSNNLLITSGTSEHEKKNHFIFLI